MTTAVRMKMRRKELGLSAEYVADKLGYSPATVYRWEKGDIEKIPMDILTPLADILHTTPAYLMGFSDDVSFSISPSPTPEAGKAHHRGVRIPVFGDVAAGVPIEATENIVDYEEIEPDLAATGTYFGLRIKGHSMEPRICEGDVVIVRKQEDADAGDVAIVLVNGDSATCKRIKKEASGLTLIPMNPSYDIKHYSSEEIAALPVRIIGKVIELRGKF